MDNAKRDPITAVAFSPSYRRYFLALPPKEAWDMFGDVPQCLNGALPENTALVIYRSGATKLVTADEKAINRSRDEYAPGSQSRVTG